jgi:hypothetical protein
MPSKVLVAHATVLPLTASRIIDALRGRQTAPPDVCIQQVTTLIQVALSIHTPSCIVIDREAP